MVSVASIANLRSRLYPQIWLLFYTFSNDKNFLCALLRFHYFFGIQVKS